MPKNSNKYTIRCVLLPSQPQITEIVHTYRWGAFFRFFFPPSVAVHRLPSMSCVSHNWCCNFESLSHLTPTENMYIFGIRFYEYVQRVFTVHRTFIWYDYAYLLTFYSFLLLLLLTSPPMLSLASTSAFCYILQYNVRYLFDICSFLLLLFPKYTLGVSSSKWFLKSHLHCANDIVRETWIWYVIFRGCCRRRRRQRCSLLFLIIFSMPI